MNVIDSLLKFASPASNRVATTAFDLLASTIGLDQPKTFLVDNYARASAATRLVPKPARKLFARSALRLALTPLGKRVLTWLFQEPPFRGRQELAQAGNPWVSYFDALEREVPGLCFRLWFDLRIIDLRTMAAGIRLFTTYFRARHTAAEERSDLLEKLFFDGSRLVKLVTSTVLLGERIRSGKGPIKADPDLGNLVKQFNKLHERYNLPTFDMRFVDLRNATAHFDWDFDPKTGEPELRDREEPIPLTLDELQLLLESELTKVGECAWALQLKFHEFATGLARDTSLAAFIEADLDGRDVSAAQEKLKAELLPKLGEFDDKHFNAPGRRPPIAVLK
jgi:hypothetical protein